MSAQDVHDLIKRARMFLRDEKFKDAVDNLRAALEMDGENIAAYNLLGISLSRLREGKKALTAFRKGVALDRENPVLHFNFAIGLETKGQPERAPTHYKAAIRFHPGWLEAMNALGLVQFRQGNYNAANRTFSKILKLDSSNAEALNNKGVVLADQGRHKDAIKKYRAALEIDGKYVKAALNLSRAQEDLGNFAESLVELERLADIAPTAWDVRTRLAALYQKLERHDDALDQARAILEKDPDNIQALRIEGAIQGIQGNDEEAKNIFERITTMNPAEDEGDSYNRFMIESPESRYWLDIVPPPAAAPSKTPPAAKPKSTHPGAIALAKARAAKAAAKAAAAGETVPAVSEPAPAAKVPDSVLEPVPEPAPIPEPAPVAEAPAAVPAAEGDLLGLMQYLMTLTKSLPEPVLDDFMHSDAHMEMKFIIDTLENPNG
ncbi:MAG: tetratricopeptide repeat protein [Treponema sp.]|jgi:tetratricopeptide (TPR) repeat protein|nr:tetratricopeptide repeat protein [Treponema sp.]